MLKFHYDNCIRTLSTYHMNRFMHANKVRSEEPNRCILQRKLMLKNTHIDVQRILYRQSFIDLHISREFSPFVAVTNVQNHDNRNEMYFIKKMMENVQDDEWN